MEKCNNTLLCTSLFFNFLIYFKIFNVEPPLQSGGNQTRRRKGQIQPPPTKSKHGIRRRGKPQQVFFVCRYRISLHKRGRKKIDFLGDGFRGSTPPPSCKKVKKRQNVKSIQHALKPHFYKKNLYLSEYRS